MLCACARARGSSACSASASASAASRAASSSLPAAVGGEAAVGGRARGRRAVEAVERGRERRLGELPLAAAQVQVADAVLDLGLQLRAPRARRRPGSSRARRRSRRRASRRSPIACVQHGRVGEAERERGAVVAERLGVRVERPRPVARDAVELGRGGLVAAEREVVRDHGGLLLAAVARAERGRDAAVQQPPPRERHALVDEAALLLVAELERPARSRRARRAPPAPRPRARPRRRCGRSRRAACRGRTSARAPPPRRRPGRASSPSAASRAPSSSRMPPGSGHSAASGSSRPSASRYSTTKKGRPPLSRWSRAARSPSRPAAATSSATSAAVSRPRASTAPRGRAAPRRAAAPTGCSGRDRLGLPADDEQQRPAARAGARGRAGAASEASSAQCASSTSTSAGRRAAEPVEQERADRLVEAHLGRGAVDGARGRRPELGHEPRDLLEPPRRAVRRRRRRRARRAAAR